MQERRTQRFRDEVEVLGATLLVRADGERLEDRERASDGWSTGETGQRVDAVTAVHRRQRRLLDGGVAAQVLEREDAAARANALDDRATDLALVQDARSLARDGLERARQIGLDELVRRLGPDRWT